MTLAPGTPHIWVHAATPALFDRERPLLEELRARHPRYRLLLTARGAETRRWLRRAFPEETVQAPPHGSAWHVRRAFGRLRPHALLFLEQPDDLGRTVFERARWWRFPVILLGGDAVDLGRTDRGGLDAVDHFLVPDERAAAALRARGVGPARIEIAGGGPVDSAASAAGSVPDRRLALLLPLLRLDWIGLGTPQPQGGLGWLHRALASKPGRAALHVGARRIDTLEALRATLSPCETILCLGNGPSSEDPAVSSVAFDCLFRVNCSWSNRGQLVRPHVVFLGDARCLRQLEDCVFAFRTIEEERRLLTDRLLHAHLRGLRFLTVERLPISLNERRWPARPTNGAVMVAMAAALEPKRLVIAGMDLFQHPAGAYPGDPATPNDYLLMHDRETEVAILDDALRRFPGEVTLLSDPLARCLEMRRAGPSAAGGR